jgi:hypothetical protein
LVLTPPAGAAENHSFFAETNGTPGAGPFEDACAIALDSGGDRYVSDYYRDAVDVFGPSGTYLTRIAKESNGNGPCALAIDTDPSSPARGDLYVDNWRAEVIRYTPSAYPPTATTTYGEPTLIDPSGTATGLAVDPASGDLYVDDGTYLAKFAAPVHAEQTPTRIGENTFHEGFGLARSSFAATAGDLYVPDAASGTVRVFGPAGESLPAIDGAGTPQAGFESLLDSAVAVDPTDGHVFVADNTEAGLSEHPVVAIDEFNPAGAYRGQISRWITHPQGEPGVSVEHALQDAEPPGLAIDSAGRIYVTSGNSDNSESSQLDQNGKPVEGSLLYTFGPTSPAKSLSLTKSGAGAGTLSSAPAGIACGPACAAEYDEGAKVTLTAAPDAHSAFAGWSGEGCAGTASTCTVTMSQARALNAEFAAIAQRTLQVGVGGPGEGDVTSSPAGIDCSAGGSPCTEEFNEGSTVTLTETPAPHSRFTGWGGPDCDESTQPTCQILMSEAKAVSAGFAPIPQRSLTVQTSGEGRVTSAPAGIDCGATCSEDFDEGASVTLTAAPAIHNQVTWSGCAAQPSAGECVVTMSAARSVAATFSPILHTLTVAVSGAGSISADHGALSGCTSGTCAAAYVDGEAVTLSATPAPGSTFAGWSGACGGTGPCHLTLGADAAAIANFAPIPTLPVPAQLTLGKLTVRGTSAALGVGVSGPGTLSALAGKDLKPAGAVASGAGPLALHLALSAAGRRRLARARHGTLTLKLTLTFTSAEGGAPAILTKAVTFTAARGQSQPGHHSKHGRH